MNQKIVFFDIDGTLMTEDMIIPESTKKAVNLLQMKGIYTVIATGRSPKMFEHVRKELNINSHISINGQCVILKEEVVYSNPLDRKMLTEIKEMMNSKGHALAYCNHEHYKVSQEDHPFISSSFEELKMPYPAVDQEFDSHSDVYQLNLFCSVQDEQQYIDRFPDYNFIRWGQYGMDILPKGCSKAIGIQKLLELLNIKKEDSYAFGDGVNDVEMFDAVGTGIAMGNAVSEAKSAAKLTTTACTEDGILKGLIKVGLLEESDVLTMN